MKTPYYMRRRTFLTGVAATATATAAQSAAPMLGPSMSLHRRFQLGTFEITTILSKKVRFSPNNYTFKKILYNFATHFRGTR